MDLGRILGAVLNGAAARPARRRPAARRGALPFGLTQTEARQIGRVVGALAGVAADALSRPAPAPAPAPAPVPPVQRAPAPARRLPETAAPRPVAAAETSEALLMLRAMIAAARADGALDRAERAAIAAQLDAAGLTAAERDRVLADFDAPATAAELAREARDPMLAAQLYAAACAGAGEVSAAERAWLDGLGAALKLDARARQAIEARLG
ncbi:DUF533 domain-containing protein [Roseococcus sp. DSY-14]|uniref:DUF533 domain-containing protein n=1 Tax=Roseococcus sp. DSY-14 TaxID=3369650 RepID=UPI00387AF261